MEKYGCGELIGEGVLGKTYLGLDRESNKQVVIKKMAVKVDKLKECSSEYLVKQLDCIPHENEYWVIMEYCPLGSVKRFLKDKVSVNEEYLREIAACCLLGLKSLHDRNVMHGDIKPENLFLSNDLVKLGDYGLSSVVKGNGLTRERAMYMAPEALKNGAVLGSDVWSLGITLVELAKGKNPYDGLSVCGIRRSVCNETPPSLSSAKWSSDCVDFINKCLVKITERPTVDELMNHPFVKESVKRIEEEGCSRVLIELQNRMKNSIHFTNVIEKAENSILTIQDYGSAYPYYEGVIVVSSSVLMELSVEGMIEVDVEEKKLLRVNDDDLNGIEHNQVLDLSDEGDRWEGDMLNDKPCGWGVLYDGEGERVYEGFRVGGVNVCYGRSFYADIQKVEYEGEWCEGKRWGRGVLYDRAGNILFDGEWVNDDHEMEKKAVITNEICLFHTGIEELIVNEKSCNGKEWRVLDLSFMSNLREFRVGDNCFKYVNEVKLIGMKKLERVLIGKNCFTKKYGNDPNRHFYLKDCERMRELKMGRYSFIDYTVCEIVNDNSLEMIEMGELNEESDNFYYASRLELKNLPQLKSLLFGDKTFRYCGVVCFENLPQLKSLLFGGYAFNFCHAVLFENLPELISIRLGETAFAFSFLFDYDDNSTSQLTMRNLPKLTTITTEGENSGSFECPRYLVLVNMPSLQTVTLPHAFECKESMIVNNIGELANHPFIPHHNPNATVHNREEWLNLSSSITQLIMDRLSCNEEELTSIDFSKYAMLELIEIGDDCFENVNEVKMIGMKKLERVLIGKNCFTREKGSCGDDPNRHFYLKDCERMRELKMGRYSFSDYAVCEIVNVNSLEVIEMGDLNEWSNNFINASRLELKNLPQLKSLLFGGGAFCECHAVLFENLPQLISIRFGTGAFHFKYGDESSQLTMRNLPKLTTLTTEGNSGSFRCPRHIVLEDMPSLQTVTLPYAFEKKKSMKRKNIGALARFFNYSCLFDRRRSKNSNHTLQPAILSLLSKSLNAHFIAIHSLSCLL